MARQAALGQRRFQRFSLSQPYRSPSSLPLIHQSLCRRHSSDTICTSRLHLLVHACSPSCFVFDGAVMLLRKACTVPTPSMYRVSCLARRNIAAEMQSLRTPNVATPVPNASLIQTISIPDCTASSVFPALLDGLAHALVVLLAVVLVQIRCLDVGRRAGVGIVKQTVFAMLVWVMRRLGGTAHLWMLVKMAATSYVGLQRFCRMSRHNSPVA